MPARGIAAIEAVSKEGRTTIAQQFGQAPLQVHRPLWDDTGAATVFLRTPSSGLLGGDQHTIKIKAQSDATLIIKTQSASQIYCGASKQTVSIEVEDNATVRYLPHPIILTANAEFEQTVRIDLAPKAKIEFVDHFCVGRIAMGETWKFKSFANNIEVWQQATLLFREHFHLEPSHVEFGGDTLCGAFTHFKSTILCGVEPTEQDPVAAELKRWEVARGAGRVMRLAYNQ